MLRNLQQNKKLLTSALNQDGLIKLVICLNNIVADRSSTPELLYNDEPIKSVG